MSQAQIECKDALMGGSGNILNWKWIRPEGEVVPKDCVDVSESDDENTLLCLVLDPQSDTWCIRPFNPLQEVVSTGVTKFLVVTGEATWKILQPSAFSLPAGAISGGEHRGKYGNMYVARRSGSLGMAVAAGYPQQWSFYTCDNQEDLKQDSFEILCTMS